MINTSKNDEVSDSELDSGSDLENYSYSDSEYIPKKKNKRKGNSDPCRIITRSKKKINKRVKNTNKDDSDASDIELGSDTELSEDSDLYEESKLGISSKVDSFVNIIANGLNDDKNAWTFDLSKQDIETYSDSYDKIYKELSYCPTVGDVLKTHMCFTDKCNIIEKINIYNNIAPNTYEKAELRKQIIKLFRTHTVSSLETVEKELISFQSDSLKTQILMLPSSYKNKQLIYNKYLHLQSLNSMSSEYPKLKIWIQNALKMPYKINKNINFVNHRNGLWDYLKSVRTILDDSIYGMNNVKTQIICILNSMITGNGKPTGIAMVGPQGVGKTEMAYAISRAISLPFVSIPMGGASSGEVLTGISYSYEGSQPGEIFNSLNQMEQLNGIIFMDEIDKVSKTTHGDEISKLLLHITDTTQNHNFTDKYMGNQFQIDLSQVLFIYSLNYINLMNKTLRDRISIIQVDGYTNAEKSEIAEKYLIPKINKTLNIDKYDITVNKEALQYIIRETNKEYTFETMQDGKSGVRQLKHKLEILFNKINLQITKSQSTSNSDKIKMPYNITKSDIDKFKLFKEKNITQLSMYT